MHQNQIISAFYFLLLAFFSLFGLTVITYAEQTNCHRTAIPDSEESKKINKQKNEDAQSNGDYLKWRELNENDKEDSKSTIMQQRMPKPADINANLDRNQIYLAMDASKTLSAEPFCQSSIIDYIQMVTDWISEQINNIIRYIQDLWHRVLQSIRDATNK